MGVGTYGEDYSGAGRSINVDGPLEVDQDEYDDFNEHMLATVAGIATELGFTSIRQGRFSGERVDFDREITGIASGSVFDIGWRSWQHDFVIAIGPASEDFGSFIANGGQDACWAIWERGRAPQQLKADYESVLDDLEKLVRYSLLARGFETAVKTSGYTSARDEVPEDVAGQITGLKVRVKDGLALLGRPAETALPDLSAEERLEVAKAVLQADDWHMGSRPSIYVPVYDIEGDRVGLWDPAEPESGIMVSRGYPRGLGSYLQSLPSVEGFASIPATPETEAFYASLTDTRREMRIAVSAEQYSEITSEPCIVAWKDDETGERGTMVLHGEAPASAMAP